MKEPSSQRQHYHQLDALRGVAALSVVVSHFALVGPLEWASQSPFRVNSLGHQAVILFFILSGFVLTLQLRSSRSISYRDFLVKRICRIYLPYLVVLVATFSIVSALDVKPIKWLGGWGNEVWSATNYNNTTVVWKGDDATGKPLPDATYFYIVKVNGTTYKGWVQLTR